jgi:hypothetical protein
VIVEQCYFQLDPPVFRVPQEILRFELDLVPGAQLETSRFKWETPSPLLVVVTLLLRLVQLQEPGALGVV